MSPSPLQHNVKFVKKKQAILRSLNTPSASYTDASPKGSVDEEIKSLIDLINSKDEFATTSSCAGRISIFLEGGKVSKGPHYDASDHDSDTKYEDVDRRHGCQHNEETSLSIDETRSHPGKATGGRWLFVTHAQVNLTDQRTLTWQHFGLDANTAADTQIPVELHGSRFAHFKFEPMILHVLTASISASHTLLNAALQAGFRESGISGLGSSCPMVAIRCQGLALDCIVGCSPLQSDVNLHSSSDHVFPIVTEEYLRMLLRISNYRFVQNSQRISRLHDLVEAAAAKLSEHIESESPVLARENKETRRHRKREEGLRKQQEIKELKKVETGSVTKDVLDEGMSNDTD